MSERNGKRKVYRFLAGAVLAGELSVLADIAVVLLGQMFSLSVFLLLAAGLTLSFYIFDCFTRKNLTIAAGTIFAVIILAGSAGALVWDQFGSWADYNPVDSGKKELYAERDVMVIVPHQDDELNILGGVMEEYVRYGSNVYPVFVTNGDYYGIPETRFREALDVCAHMGIPKENVIFLGYGDTWAEGGPHIYNAEPGVVIESYHGKTATYGTEAHGVFRAGNPYSIDNYLKDLEDVILSRKPDVIFCSDYDSHIDHKALSMAFEKVMGKILKENPDYRPQVFKGYAYMSAWYAQPDYYAPNILSTGNVFEVPYYQYPKNYQWEERVRFPVDASLLSRSLLHSGAHETMLLYSSQDAQLHTAGVVNGDKVFWKRDTNSLCYGAEIFTSSSDSALLNDFMLLENFNLIDPEHSPFDGVWIPAAEDEERTVTVALDRPSDIYSVVLYDHPSETQNILDAVIIFDDGIQLRTGPLAPGGAATEILVQKTDVSSFRIRLVLTEGEAAGLTEVEAFSGKRTTDMKLLKIVDRDGNFVYDYWTAPQGNALFGFYTYGEVLPVTPENYRISCDNVRCSIQWENGNFAVFCPSGETATVTVTDSDGVVSDSIYIQNPGWRERLQCWLCQTVEELLYVGYCEGRHWQLATVRILDQFRK